MKKTGIFSIVFLAIALTATSAKADVKSYNFDGIRHQDDEMVSHLLRSIERAIDLSCQNITPSNDKVKIQSIDKMDEGAQTALYGATLDPLPEGCPIDEPCSTPHYSGGVVKVVGYMPSFTITLRRTGGKFSYPITVTGRYIPTDMPYMQDVVTLSAAQCGGTKSFELPAEH